MSNQIAYSSAHMRLSRPAIPRLTSGSGNNSWRGSAAGYDAMHLRVKVARGRAAECSRCGKNDPDARYEWANLTGRYDDIDDFAPMCIFCHRRYDAARRAATGGLTRPARFVDKPRAWREEERYDWPDGEPR